jgi:hypothetical protein
MTPNDLELRKKWRLELEKLGPEQVRIALQNQTHMANVEHAYAWEWLRELDERKTAEDRRSAKLNLAVTCVAAVAGVIAAVTGILALIK